MPVLPTEDVSDTATRYHEYVNADTAFNAFEDYRLKREVSLNGVNLNSSKFKEPDMRVAEAELGPRHELMSAYIKANLQYSRWFRRGAEPGVHWTAYGPLDPEAVDWEDCLTTAQGWINECIDLHKNCDAVSNGMLPTRVVDVGPCDGSQEPRLIETGHSHGTYIALSYCWGKSQPLITTSDNIQERKSGIPLSDCPPTVRDAILASRKLNCRYVWIDALCIIQDSTKDWESEAAKMQDVYKNSWITIVAEAADSTACGFLRGRTLRGREEETPLKSRGWTLQEHLLSPRRLIYHHDHLSFACQSVLNSDGLSHCRISALLSKPKSYLIWENVIHEYSRRHLSKEKDKLPALSGLAHEFQRINQDAYLAGLWRSNLLGGLLWGREGYISRPKPSYRAPSWSWAAHQIQTNYFVRNKGSHESYLAEVLGAATDLRGKDPFGQVSGGSIRIRAPIRQGRLVQPSKFRRMRSEESYDSWSRQNDLAPEGYPSWVFAAKPIYCATGFGTTINRTADILRYLGTENIFATVFLDDDESIKVKAPVLLLLIRTDRRQDDGRDDLGLVLKPVAKANSFYQRLGIFVMRTQDREKCFGGSSIQEVEVI